MNERMGRQEGKQINFFFFFGGEIIRLSAFNNEGQLEASLYSSIKTKH